jgi:hypothetical protein
VSGWGAFDRLTFADPDGKLAGPAHLDRSRGRAVEVYFPDRCDILEEVTYEDEGGALASSTDQLRLPNVPCHVLNIAALYARQETGGLLQPGNPPLEDVTGESQMIAFPHGYVIRITDVVELHKLPGALWRIDSTGDVGTTDLMNVCRMTRLGSPNAVTP